MIKLVCLVGPTASGKSELANFLAQEIGGEVVNADSRQFYAEFKIGTARPEPTQVNVPHHLVGVASIVSPWDVAFFVGKADAAIAEIVGRNKVPLIVGGTGMYLKCLLIGLDQIPRISPEVQEEIETRLKKDGVESLYNELLSLDPLTAKSLARHDKQRICRALGVCRQTGQSVREFWFKGKKAARYDFTKIGLTCDRADLYRRIDTRVDEMLKSGLKGEVQKLLAEFGKTELLGKTIGYREWMELGFDDDKKVVENIKKNSRNFAKRQLTWFRHEPEVIWYSLAQKQEVLAQVRAFL